jgi:hypothetical protein
MRCDALRLGKVWGRRRVLCNKIMRADVHPKELSYLMFQTEQQGAIDNGSIKIFSEISRNMRAWGKLNCPPSPRQLLPSPPSFFPPWLPLATSPPVAAISLSTTSLSHLPLTSRLHRTPQCRVVAPARPPRPPSPEDRFAAGYGGGDAKPIPSTHPIFRRRTTGTSSPSRQPSPSAPPPRTPLPPSQLGLDPFLRGPSLPGRTTTTTTRTAHKNRRGPS